MASHLSLIPIIGGVAFGKKTLHRGQAPAFGDMEEKLKDFVTHKCTEGIAVTAKMVIVFACTLSQGFTNLSKAAQISWMERFKARNKFCYVNKVITDGEKTLQTGDTEENHH
eukprot:TRINITY_DN2431_c0_g1_i4.p1 TRINITY_DN2431_c0_g1~~TRINITY_DN2431_c0_g1_i4.p1  ORF type:complete len:112 (+),score=17.08 TRINITY_DN2431_c0_g1_i4:454-789(+)